MACAAPTACSSAASNVDLGVVGMRKRVQLALHLLVLCGGRAWAGPSPPAPCGSLDLGSPLTQHCFPEDGEGCGDLGGSERAEENQEPASYPGCCLPPATQRFAPLCVLRADHAARQPRLAPRQPKPTGGGHPRGLRPVQLLLVHLLGGDMHAAARRACGLEPARRRLDWVPAQLAESVQRSHRA